MLRERCCLYECEHECLDTCDMYAPLTEEAAEAEIDDMIEDNRIAFRAEWFEYIENCND